MQRLIVEEWASNEAAMILTGEWCGFVFRTRISECKCWITTMKCGVVVFYDETSMGPMGEPRTDLFQILHLKIAIETS